MYKLENNVAWTTDLKNAFKHGITRGKIKYIDDNNNEVIITESNGIKSIKIYDEKNVKEQGFIGQATSRQVDVELVGTINETNLENKEVEVFLGADYLTSTEPYADLPIEYQQVEYIESTGTQYIDTNYVFNSGISKLYIDFQDMSSSLNNYLSLCATQVNQSRCLCIEKKGDTTKSAGGNITADDGINYGNLGNTRHKIELTYNENTLKYSAILDGIFINEKTSDTSFINNKNLLLFAKNGTTVTQFSKYKIFNIKIIDNFLLVRDMIPCYRKSDNVIGLYDKVNDVFYTNNGTGTFNKGNDVIRTYYINYGKFIVNSAPENDATNNTIKFTAFDYMIKFNDLYKPNVTFPCTIKDMLDDICETCGVTLATQSFANMDFTVDSNQFDTKTNRDVLKHIGKCAFSWVRIGQDNQLYLDFSVPSVVTETLDIGDYFQDNFKKANENYGPINRVVYAESNIDGQEEKVEDTDSIALNGLHELVIYDNYFAYTTAYRQELIQAGTRLFGLEFTPVQTLKMVGLPYLDCTDLIEITEPDETTIQTIPLNHIIEYNGAIGDTLSSETESEIETVYKNTNNPMVANSLAEIIVDRAMRQIQLIVDQYVNFLRYATGNNRIYIEGTRTGIGFIPKFVIKGNTEIFEDYVLPSGYARVEYIESTGKQYIDLDYIPNDNTKLVIDATSYGSYGEYEMLIGDLTGVRENSNTNSLYINTALNLILGYFVENFQWNNDYNTYRTNLKDRYTYELSMTESKFNNETESISATSYTWNYPLYVFASNNEGTAYNYSVRKLYSYKIYENDVLVRDYIPCMKLETGELGLYERVNDMFYMWYGTGQLKHGKFFTLTVSEGIQNQETTLITEDENTLLAEDSNVLIGEDNTLIANEFQIILTEVLRDLTIDGVTYYDELQIFSDGKMQIVKRIGESSGVLYLLDEEVIIPLEDKIVLPTNENGYYYYVKEINGLDYYAEYIIKNEYSDIYATEAYVNAGLDLKIDTEKLISYINASADTIKLVGKRLIIEMPNFMLDENGYMTAVAGMIGGFNLDEDSLDVNIEENFRTFTQQDLTNINNLIQSENWNESDLEKYDINGNQIIDTDDYERALAIYNEEDYPSQNGSFTIQNNGIRKNINFKDTNGNITQALGLYGGFLTNICIENVKIKGGTITVSSVTQTSKEEVKKNITKFERNALELVKNNDIYEYNYKNEKDTDKKHIGFIIGNEYKTPNEIISQNKDSIDISSMVSVLWKAVQEQQKQIEKLQREIEKLKGEE